jgi:hypothetical protein
MGVDGVAAAGDPDISIGKSSYARKCVKRKKP